jgi:hypothetical protein
MKAAVCVVLWCLAVGVSFAHAQACHPPGSFYRTSAIRGTIALEPGPGPDCNIVARLDVIESPSAGAYAWYTLPHPVQTWRISLRLNTSQLGDLTPFESVIFLAASTRTPYPHDDGNVGLLRAVIQGSPSGGLQLLLLPACQDSSTDYYCPLVAYAGLVSGDLVRFELKVGTGAAGYVRWWINADFSDPPTGSVEDLDNADWNGVETVALGSFDSYLQHAAQLRIFDIESADDTIFWNGFSY